MAANMPLFAVVVVAFALALQFVPSSMKQTAYYAVLSVADSSNLLGGSMPVYMPVGKSDADGWGLFHNGSVTFPPLWLDDRRRLQGRWSVAEKGWLVPLTWGPAPKHGGGIGVYAVSDIKAGTLIRKSAMDENLYERIAMDENMGSSRSTASLTPSVFLRMRSYADLEKFSRGRTGHATTAERAALLRYISDYLFVPREPFGSPAQTDDSQRVFGIWIPGCADNDANADETANVEDRLTPPEMIMNGISPTPTPTRFMGMYATRDIAAGEILLSDYNGAFGSPPKWAASFADDHLGGWLAFAGYNHHSRQVREAVSGAA